MIRKWCNQEKIPTTKTEVEKTKLTIRYSYKEKQSGTHTKRMYHKPSEQLFTIFALLAGFLLTKNQYWKIR